MRCALISKIVYVNNSRQLSCTVQYSTLIVRRCSTVQTRQYLRQTLNSMEITIRSLSHGNILILTLKFAYRDAGSSPVDPTAVRASWFTAGPRFWSSKISRGYLRTGLRPFSDRRQLSGSLLENVGSNPGCHTVIKGC